MSIEPVNSKLDIETLLAWLGPNGAKQGLLHSDLDAVSLLAILGDGEVSLSSKPSREEIVHEIIFSRLPRVKLKNEALLRMTKDELIDFFKKTHPSRREIVELLNRLGLRVGSEAKRNLIVFAAGEISDMGVYERVSRKGSQKPTK
jgi:ABC-type enterochelin transport system ATPase subunit